MKNKLMGKERLGAFMDAVLAIVMTILVLELEKPETFDLAGLWELRESFFAYTLSFFWLGAMWVNLHSGYSQIKHISQKTVWATMIMLFTSSLFPYATKLISSDFNNTTMQIFYGVIVLLITFSVLYYTHTLREANLENEAFQDNVTNRRAWVPWDILIKVIGLALSFVFPPAMALSVLITLCVLVIPHQLR